MKTAKDIKLSRRGFVKTVGAGALVAGFNTVSSRWVPVAQAQTDDAAQQGLARLPFLHGKLFFDEATRNLYAEDFGQIVHEQPLAVLKPGSVRDISQLIRFVQRHGIRIVGRGRGHTTFGQAQGQAGVVIDMSTLNTIHTISNDRVVVDAGIRWHDLLQATLAQGLMPPVLTDYIGQSVGGTLSVGGVGGMMARYGAQVDQVLELQVVTGEGKVVTCSASYHRDLFEAVLAGQGQCAVITRATLRLVPAPQQVRFYSLVYPDLATMTAEITRLLDDERFHYLVAWSFPQPDGSWLHLLQAGSYYDAPSEPNDAALLAGLHFIPGTMQIEDLPFWDFATRVGLEFPKQLHAWIDLILPYPAIDTFVTEVEGTLKPVTEGDNFSILLIPMKPGRFTRPLFRAPASDHAVQFGILRFTPLDPQLIDSLLAFNRTLYDRCRELGGTYYPISAVQLSRQDWEQHYGPQWDRLQAAKECFDPHNVFASGPDIFAAATAAGVEETAEELSFKSYLPLVQR